MKKTKQTQLLDEVPERHDGAAAAEEGRQSKGQHHGQPRPRLPGVVHPAKSEEKRLVRESRAAFFGEDNLGPKCELVSCFLMFN